MSSEDEQWLSDSGKSNVAGPGRESESRFFHEECQRRQEAARKNNASNFHSQAPSYGAPSPEVTFAVIALVVAIGLVVNLGSNFVSWCFDGHDKTSYVINFAISLGILALIVSIAAIVNIVAFVRKRTWRYVYLEETWILTLSIGSALAWCVDIPVIEITLAYKLYDPTTTLIWFGLFCLSFVLAIATLVLARIIHKTSKRSTLCRIER